MQFSSTLRSALIGLCLSAISVAAAPGLSLSVAGASGAFTGVENFKVTASLVNSGDEPLKLLRDPRTIISTIPTNSFAIGNAEGASPAFVGAKVKYVPDTVVKNSIEEAFVTLAPGESLHVDHDLSSAYNFTLPGEGTYNVHANNLFLYVDPATNEIKELQAVHEAPFTSSLTGKLAVAPRYSKREVYQSCSSSQQSQVASAANQAVTYANGASSYASSHTSSTPRYVEWFGAYTDSRHSTVVSHYNNIKGYSFTGNTYDCSCTEAGTYAYVVLSEFGVIHLCPVFWEAPLSGTDSKGGTLIHESSHFTQIAGTDDHVYGQSAARSLAKSNPTEAIDNADNHEYFAENNPALS
ncbi:peptidyl-Lys metalloendopeptidase [Marasmius fiardii PR-910]|nr:peptidyl-Lys metalloendopeptidase [Marasmius fiardii PR-910]